MEPGDQTPIVLPSEPPSAATALTSASSSEVGVLGPAAPLASPSSSANTTKSSPAQQAKPKPTPPNAKSAKPIPPSATPILSPNAGESDTVVQPNQEPASSKPPSASLSSSPKSSAFPSLVCYMPPVSDIEFGQLQKAAYALPKGHAPVPKDASYRSWAPPTGFGIELCYVEESIFKTAQNRKDVYLVAKKLREDHISKFIEQDH